DHLLGNLPKDSTRRDVSLVAGYLNPEVKKMSELLHAGLEQLNAPKSSTILQCSRLYRGQHSQTVSEAIKLAGYQVQTAPYLIDDSQDFASYLDKLLERAPLRYEL